MKSKSEKAIASFQGDYNCAQSVLSVFSDSLQIGEEQCLKIASPFGAGIAYMQESCGAVSGALMAIGLKYGQGANGSSLDKETAYDISQHFINEFKKSFGSVKCKDLLDQLNLSTPEGLSKIKEQNLFRLRCDRHVQEAVHIVENIFEKLKIE